MSFTSVAEFEALTGEDAPTTAEKKLIKATKVGRNCFLCDEKNPSRPTTATDETRIRAPLLRLLITGGTKACTLHERGVSLTGGWIEGDLDLSYCNAKGQTLLEYCVFEKKPDFEQTRLNLLSLDRCSMPGLRMQGTTIVDALFLSHLVSFGTVNLSGAQIGGQVAMIRAELYGDPGKALFGQGIRVTHSMLLDGLQAHGMLDLNGAEIGGSLSLREAKVFGVTVDASNDPRQVDLSSLKIESARIKNSVFLDKVNALGTINTIGSRIDGQLSIVEATLDGNGSDALFAQSMQVAQSFVFQRPKKVVGNIDLSTANVSDLTDDCSEWLNSLNHLVLDGFSYSRLAGNAPTSFNARRASFLAGSQRLGAFYPQPYTQLAKVLRQMGHAGEARLVLIEREGLLAEHRIAADHAAYRDALHGDQTQRGDARRIRLRMTGFRLWTWLTKTIAGYGYAPQRALYCSLFVVPLFAFAYALFWQMGAMVPADAIMLATPEWANAVAANPSAPSHAWAGPAASHYETFYSLPYALDVFLPIVDLGQQSTWSQTTVTWWGWRARVTTWVLQSLGYVITSLGLAAATGIIQRNQPD